MRMTQKLLNGQPHRPEIRRALTVGEVAARSGVAVSTLHFYEAEGLISSWRNSGNQRRYAREVLRRVAVIKVAQRTGIPLARDSGSSGDAAGEAHSNVGGLERALGSMEVATQ